MDGYYYLHTNGELIYKPERVVDDDEKYFDSPFVKKVWRLDATDRLCAWRIILEALAMGCKISRAKELAEKWGLTFEDAVEMLKRVAKDGANDAMIDGLKIFIPEILKMDIEHFWAKTEEMLDGKVDEAGDKGQAKTTR